MVGYLTGTILRKTATALVVKVGEIGYEITVSPILITEKKNGDTITLWCHLVVSEDKQELFGFSTPEELDLFRELDAVSGVGPKSALAITTIADPDAIRAAIGRGDPTILQKVSGIGRKIAERIVVELRPKYERLGLGHKGVTGDDEVIDALTGLGYSLTQARTAVQKLPRDLEGSSARIRAALKLLGKV